MWCNELLSEQRLEARDHRCHRRFINKAPTKIGTGAQPESEEEPMLVEQLTA